MTYLLEKLKIRIPFLDNIDIQVYTYILYGLIILCSLAVFLIIFVSYRRQSFTKKTTDDKDFLNAMESQITKYAVEQLKNNKSSFYNYDNMYAWLKRNGMIEAPGRNTTPELHMMKKIFLAMGLLLVLLILGQPLLALFLMVWGFFIPDVLVKLKNRSDNKKMMSDIASLYSKISMQLKSNVYIADTFYDCYKYCENPRLKKALEILNAQCKVSNNVNEALDEFASKFDNSGLIILVKVIKQSQETGKHERALESMMSEMRSIQRAYNKLYTDNMTSKLSVICVCILGILAMLLFMIMIGSIGNDLAKIFEI